MADHYTAVIIVNRTIDAKTTPGRGYNDPTVLVSPREVTEIAHITVRADTLATLTAKVVAHTELIEES